MGAIFSFDPYDDTERENAKRLIATIEAQLKSEKPDSQKVLLQEHSKEPAVPSRESQVKNLLETEAGRLIYGAAAEHFAPEELFSLNDLATKSEHETGHVLAWWRRLGGRHERVGGNLFTRHDGRPVQFSLDQQTRSLIRKQLRLGN
jgi:hypothetical protein